VKSDVCELYKLLHNPLRLEMLRRVYASRDGMNVGVLVDEMMPGDIKQSCVSQYLMQLAKASVIVRRRAGRYANYYADNALASARVRAAVYTTVSELEKTPDLDFSRFFGVMMNPFRAAVICAISKYGAMDAAAICERFDHQVKYVKRDLQVAVDAGILAIDDSDSPTYRFVEPSVRVFSKLISLCD